jgi:signal transduction histidine kinase
MEQVFVNLLTNAFGHNPPGTKVSISARPHEDEVVITVHDDGVGMPPPGVRSRSAGAGLGLSIARGIVQAHGGALDLIEQEAAGTCFGVRLPIEGSRDD